MQNVENRSRIIIDAGHIVCPVCKANLQRVPPDMVAKNMPVYCRHCKIEYNVNIDSGQRLKASAAAVESLET